jgi:hypothetical protein
LLPPPPPPFLFDGDVLVGRPLDIVRTEVNGATDPVPVGVTTIVVTIAVADPVVVGFEVLVPSDEVLVPVDVAVLLDDDDDLLEPPNARN